MQDQHSLVFYTFSRRLMETEVTNIITWARIKINAISDNFKNPRPLLCICYG
jgi:hypothetical protein